MKHPVNDHDRRNVGSLLRGRRGMASPVAGVLALLALLLTSEAAHAAATAIMRVLDLGNNAISERCTGQTYKVLTTVQLPDPGPAFLESSVDGDTWSTLLATSGPTTGTILAPLFTASENGIRFRVRLPDGTVLTTTDPLIVHAVTVACSGPITATADPGQSSASGLDPAEPPATSECGDATVTGARSDTLALTDPYPVGTTTITWTALTTGGGAASCTQTVEVERSTLACDCAAFPFLVARRATLNFNATVNGSLGANDPGGLLRIGHRVTLADGTTAAASTVRLGDRASVFDVDADRLLERTTSEVRGTRGMVTLPLASPFCALPPISCTPGNDVVVRNGDTASPPPGSYGSLRVGNGATVNLEPDGTYDFCDVQVGRSASVQSTSQVTINVRDDVRMAAGSRLWTPEIVNDPPVVLNVGGRLVRISPGDVVKAIITAPNAKIRIQRAGEFYGCLCADELGAGRNARMECFE